MLVMINYFFKELNIVSAAVFGLIVVATAASIICGLWRRMRDACLKMNCLAQNTGHVSCSTVKGN
jgi:hypothetical protein